MTDLLTCIANGITEGSITPEQGRAASDMFENIRDALTDRMGPEAASASAARQTFDQLAADAAHKKRTKLLQIQRYRSLERNMNEFESDRPGKALQALVARDKRANFQNIEGVYQSTRKQAFAQMAEILGRYRKGVIGQTRYSAELPTLVREVFGEDTGNVPAREMAESWRIVSDGLRKRANAAGMRIPKRADWGMPQSHDMLSVRKVTEAEWKDFIRDRLDPAKMIDEKTGLPMNAETLELALSEVYTTIVEGGLNKVSTPKFSAGGTSLANRRTDHRFLVFKDPDAWLEYQQKFGEPDPFATMIRHVESMSRDIAMLEVFGPNPNAMITALKTRAKKIAVNTDLENTLSGDLAFFDAIYDIFTGRANVADNQLIADIGAGTRNILNASLLGGAFLSALSDLGTQRMAAMMVGMPQTQLIGKILREFQPLNIEERGKLAVRLGLGADNWIQTAYAQARMFDEVTGPEITRRISDTVMRISGLSPWTQAGRQAFGIEFTGYLTENIGKRFDELDSGLQDVMRQHGIGADRWDIIRATPLYKDADSGLTILRLLDVENRTDLAPGLARELSTQAMSMVEMLTDMAVPVSTTRAKATLRGNVKPGSLIGEIAGSFTQFKNFPVTIFHEHIHRYMLMDGAASKTKYMMNFVIGTTVMGALALQLKDMAKGRDPRPMDNPAFWTAAMLQGGGLGIFGDFMFSQVNRMGSGLKGTIAGPSIGMLDDLRNLTFGNAVEFSQGKDTNFGSESVKFLSKYTPGSSIWYLRAGLERQLFDRLQDWVDPDAAKKFRRKVKLYEREYGQGMWWMPNENLPRRAPNFANALGQ
uniref:Uncharacterized protein n=1 Tax=uncultured marine virus TaxID=186617 RepID=A0A0F7L5T6_9VIRU|nr:hypothetical protein [uncultured marine virus]